MTYAPATFATVAPGATGIAGTMSGNTRQPTSEAMNAMLRMSASFRAAPESRRRQSEPAATQMQIGRPARKLQAAAGGRRCGHGRFRRLMGWIFKIVQPAATASCRVRIELRHLAVCRWRQAEAAPPFPFLRSRVRGENARCMACQ
jgi:hypothetical protein